MPKTAIKPPVLICKLEEQMEGRGKVHKRVIKNIYIMGHTKGPVFQQINNKKKKRDGEGKPEHWLKCHIKSQKGQS